MTMRLSIIVAAARNNVIGSDGGMPWRLSSDLQRFKKLTLGKPIIMGRKTFDSIGKPLPGRTNIVVTRDKEWQSPGAVNVRSLDQAIEMANEISSSSGAEELFVIGGGEIYRQALDLVDRIYLTRVEADIEGDTKFPKLKEEDWRSSNEEHIPADAKNSHPTTFVVLDRVNDR